MPRGLAYKASPLTYILGRMLVKGVDFIGMPNILAGRANSCRNLYSVTSPWRSWCERPSRCLATRSHETVAALKSLREKLGSPGAAGRVATIALEMIASRMAA